MATELLVMKAPGGALIPVRDEDRAALATWKTGQGVRVKVSRMRNLPFFRRWWLLAKLAFEAWAETAPKQQYKGVDVLPEFNRFRRDLLIMAGFYRPVWNIKGELRLDPESLKFASMSEERFEQVYQATITTILQKIIPNAGYDERTLRATVDRLMEFA